MPFRGVEQSFTVDDFRFEIAFDAGSEASLEQRDVYYRTRNHHGEWGDAEALRSFYFDDLTEANIRAFCERFAQDSTYRAMCLAGAAEWARRDELFRRNITAQFGQQTDLITKLETPQAAYDFIKAHWTQILALPEYKRIQALDTAFNPNMVDLDPGIEAAVYAFNRMAGVQTRFSCQGVSGVVPFEGIEFMTVSPHYRFGYIAFEQISTATEAQITALLAEYPAAQYVLTDPAMNKMALLSTGDNLAFRPAAFAIAEALEV